MLVGTEMLLDMGASLDTSSINEKGGVMQKPSRANGKRSRSESRGAKKGNGSAKVEGKLRELATKLELEVPELPRIVSKAHRPPTGRGI